MVSFQNTPFEIAFIDFKLIREVNKYGYIIKYILQKPKEYTNFSETFYPFYCQLCHSDGISWYQKKHDGRLD